MRRNIGNEVVIAFLVVAVLVVALVAAVLLSDSQSDADSTATQVALQSESNTPTPTNTPVSPTATTETAESSVTESETPTEPLTEVSPSATGHGTNTPTATDTSRPIATPSKTATLTATDTSRPPASPTKTPTQHPTVTPLSPTVSPTVTATSQSVRGIIPTPPPSPTVEPPDKPTRQPSTCRKPQGWTQYEVVAGNTLFAIAQATRSTVEELRYANCIENVDNIKVGQIIFVPRTPLRPVATIPPAGGRPGLAQIGCTDPDIRITSPAPGQHISGTFTLFGTAAREDFQYYKIEIRPDWAPVYDFYLDSRTPVHEGALGAINSQIFDDGLHWLLLTVVDQNFAIPLGATCEIPVIFD